MHTTRYFAALAVCAVLLTGCGTSVYPELPENAIRFEMKQYIDHNDDDAYYGIITYAGRDYLPYGTISRSLHQEDISACIGYLGDTDTRIYTLTADPSHDFLMEYYIGTTEMNQPSFWRAADTMGKPVSTPDCINSLDYSLWQTPERS